MAYVTLRPSISYAPTAGGIAVLAGSNSSTERVQVGERNTGGWGTFNTFTVMVALVAEVASALDCAWTSSVYTDCWW